MKTTTEPKRPPGRPATGQMPKRYFRMDDDGWARIERAAALSGVSVSEWIRDKLIRASKREAGAS